jgi:hypothetical protein
MYSFGVFEFTSDLFQSQSVELIDKTFSIEILETPDLKKNPNARKVIGKT